MSAALGEQAPAVRIESLSHEGRGVAHVGGKATFVDGALPGETVTLHYLRRRGRFDEARAREVLGPAPWRVEPRCAHFGVCGGCSLQHLDPAAQLEHKQSVLLAQLEHQAGVRPDAVLAPIAGPVWGYRRKARLGVRHVPKKGGVLVGFRERRSPYVAALDGCEVLHPAVGRLIPALRALIAALDARARIPQLEVAVGEPLAEGGGDVAAIVVRHLTALGARDRARLAEFSEAHGVDFYLQAGGPDTVCPLAPGGLRPLRYRLPRHDVVIEFGPVDFTQVNFDVNRMLVDRVLDLLAPDGLRVLDLFCGLGNFTLPIARRAAAVTGVEGDATLVARARANARANGLPAVEILTADLSAGWSPALAARRFDAVLLDPPRSGAAALLEQLALDGVRRVVYVSCNPATLARDVATLVHRRGLRLAAAGVVDMFPHTAHVESLAVLEP